MLGNLKLFRTTVSLAVALGLTVGISGLVSAQSVPTEIDIDAPVALTLGQAVMTPFDQDTVDRRYFTFRGKANDIVTVTATHLSGNFGFSVRVSSQNDVELASTSGHFLESNDLSVKLPQDGKYTVHVSISDPGADDPAAGTLSVVVNSGMPSRSGTPAK